MNKLQYHCSNSAPYSVSIHVLNADFTIYFCIPNKRKWPIRNPLKVNFALFGHILVL